MIQTVIKRDGRIVGFNEEKIATAIRKAMLHTENGEDRELVRQITDHISFKGDSQMTVEAIQDAVELELMNSSRKDVAQKIHSLPQPAQHRPQSQDTRYVPGDHQYQIQRHHPRECQYECRHARRHDDEVLQRNDQAVRRRLLVERRGQGGGRKQLSAYP